MSQNFARKYKIPIDKLGFQYQMMREDRMPEKPEDGAFIYVSIMVIFSTFFSGFLKKYDIMFDFTAS